jgi:hypothetical protein
VPVPLSRKASGQQDGYTVGRIQQYEIYLSTDGVTWGIPVVSGIFADTALPSLITFSPTSGRYLRLRALSEYGPAGTATTVAELSVHVINAPPEGVIVEPAADSVTITAGETVQFAGSGSSSEGNIPLSYRWTFGEGSGNSEFLERDPGLVRFHMPGTFEVRCTVTDSIGLVDPTPPTRTVVVQAPPDLISIPRDGMRLHYVDSEELNGSASGPTYPAVNVIDGDINTFWHTEWVRALPGFPHEVQIDLGQSHLVRAIEHSPRQDGYRVGRVKQYELFVSVDDTTWGAPVAAGLLPDTSAPTLVVFSPTPGQYVRFVAWSEYGPAESVASVAELTVHAAGLDWVQPQPDALVGVGLDLPLRLNTSDSLGPLTKVEFFADGQPVGTAMEAPFEYLWQPPQPGEYALWAVATDDSGLLGLSSTNQVIAVPVFQQTRTLISAGARWDYLDTGIDPGPGWTLLEADTSEWSSGNGEFGYGDGDETTVVSFGPSSSNKHITTWFRHVFRLSEGPMITSAELHTVSDDGFVAYLNGTEVHRDNLPEGIILPSTTALVAIGGTNESTWASVQIPAVHFTAGDNVLAVEMHQANRTSSDLSFDAGLEVVETTFGPAIRTQPENQTAIEGTTARFSVTAAGTAPLSYQWQFQGQEIPGATQSELTIDNLEWDQAGEYRVVVSNAAGGITSQQAVLTIQKADSDGDGLPDDWELANGLDPRNPNGADGAAGDPDNDGFTNLEEYLAGTDPRAAGSVLRLSIIDVNSSQGTVVLRFEAVAERSYTLQAASQLPGPGWSAILDIATRSTNHTVTIEIPLGEGTGQGYRLLTPAQP